MSMSSSYYPWTGQCHQNWEGLSSIPHYDYRQYGTSYVYLILASEEWVSFQQVKFRITCVIYQARSGTYFECVFTGNDSPDADKTSRSSYSIYRYMKSQMRRSLKTIFKFVNTRRHQMIEKLPGKVSVWYLKYYLKLHIEY